MWPNEEPLVPVCTSSLLNTQLSSSNLCNVQWPFLCWMMTLWDFLDWIWGTISPFMKFSYSWSSCGENWKMCKKRENCKIRKRRTPTGEWKGATSVGETPQRREHPQLLTKVQSQHISYSPDLMGFSLLSPSLTRTLQVKWQNWWRKCKYAGGDHVYLKTEFATFKTSQWLDILG